MNSCLLLSFILYVPKLYLILIDKKRCEYVIAWVGVKFGINFTSCSENSNEIARGAAERHFAVIATMSGIYPKISLLPVLSQINTIASFVKVKISDFQTRSGFLLLRASHGGSGLTFFVLMVEADSLPSQVVVTDLFRTSSFCCSRSKVKYVGENRRKKTELSKSSSRHFVDCSDYLLCSCSELNCHQR